jgi:glucose-1-phosphate thymidylyltransferase
MWGIVPAAGKGSRIQPLAFSKELLPVGSRLDGGVERPCAVSEYLLERMVLAGADKICFVISPGKSDIMEYFGASYAGAAIAYVVQPRPAGLCDALFRAAPFISRENGETVVVGLPDTIWFPDRALRELADDRLSLLLFPVENPNVFDSVSTERDGRVEAIQVKAARPRSHWIWGAFKMPGGTFHALHRLWEERAGRDEYFGTLINAYLENGGVAHGVKAGTDYVDVGTLGGYRAAIQLLERMGTDAAPRGRDSSFVEKLLEHAGARK